MKLIKYAVISTFVFISLSQAGIRMTAQFQNLTKPKEQPTTQTTYLGKNGIRIDMKAEKTDMTTIFRPDKELFWMIDNNKKSYVEITKLDLEKMKKGIKDVTGAIDEAIKNLPPEQRQKMEAMMKKNNAGTTQNCLQKSYQC